MRGAALFTFLLACVATPATGRTQSTATYALLRDPSGAPVAGARGQLVCEPAYELVALRPVAAGLTDLPLPGRSVREALSSDRGVLRFSAPADQRLTAGSGMVTTTAGLGALLPRLHPGRAARITLQPLAAIGTTTGSEPFRLFAKARLADGSTVRLPQLAGTDVRLPAGDYEIWAHSRDGWLWQRVQLHAGERHYLRFVGSSRMLRLAPGARVFPDGWPELSLGDDNAIVLLRGNAARAPLSTWLDGGLSPPRVVTAQDAKSAWPPIADRVRLDVVHRLSANNPAGTLVFGLLRRDDGSYRCICYARAADGRCALPTPPAGDAWLLLLAPGSAPTAIPWPRQPLAQPLTVPRGVPFTVRARDTTGLAVADLCVEYAPRDRDAARVVAHTDADGRATLGRAVAPGTLFVSDARFANWHIELDCIPVEPLALAAEPGASCTGKATFADGERSTAIVVTLRDPRGELRPPERVWCGQPGEAFTFAGLPEDQDLVLFATAVRNGHTWSARMLVRAGDEPVELQLRDEDPDLNPGRR